MCTIFGSISYLSLFLMKQGQLVVNFINILRVAFAPIFCAKKLQIQIVPTEKRHKTLLYKKGANIMLMKFKHLTFTKVGKISVKTTTKAFNIFTIQATLVIRGGYDPEKFVTRIYQICHFKPEHA